MHQRTVAPMHVSGIQRFSRRYFQILFHAGTSKREYFGTAWLRDYATGDSAMSRVHVFTGTLFAIVSSPIRGRGTPAVTPMIPSNRAPLRPRDSRRLRFLPVKATRRDTPCDTPNQSFSNSCATRRSVSESCPLRPPADQNRRKRTCLSSTRVFLETLSPSSQAAYSNTPWAAASSAILCASDGATPLRRISITAPR